MEILAAPLRHHGNHHIIKPLSSWVVGLTSCSVVSHRSNSSHSSSSSSNAIADITLTLASSLVSPTLVFDTNQNTGRFYSRHHDVILPISKAQRQNPIIANSAAARVASSFDYNSNLNNTTTTTTRRMYSSTIYTTRVPWKIAIVGSGPSGCYTAKYLLQALTKKQSGHDDNDYGGDGDNEGDDQQQEIPCVHIDILERLPTAYGLVRNGVAPDHPEVKNVQHDFDQLFTVTEDNENNNRIQFWGNVQVGQDVSLQELRQLYDIVVLAFGCESDRPLQIDGSDCLKNILTARQFVNWYNGHPEFDWVGPVLQQALSKKEIHQHIVVIGHGNVALDCARILAKTRNELDPTDLTTRAIDILHPPSVVTKRYISVVGRRGHIQGAFTIKEIRELTKLPHADFVVLEDELNAGASTEASQAELKKARAKQRVDTLLRDHATNSVPAISTENPSQIHLRFLLNPIRFEAKEKDPSMLGGVVCERTELQGDAGQQSAKGTGVEETLKADLCLVSIGYKGISIKGTETYFDERRGILTNIHGAVDNNNDGKGNNTDIAPLYVSGWLKRGPSGIIGTNIADAKDTVASIMKDIQAQKRQPKEIEHALMLQQLLQDRDVHVVHWEAYQRINDKETSADQKRNLTQPREKLTQWNDLLQAACSTAEK